METTMNDSRIPQQKTVEAQPADSLLSTPKPAADPLKPKPSIKRERKGKAEKAAEQPAQPQPSTEEIAAAQAANLRDAAGATYAYIAVSSSIAPNVSTEAFKVYRNQLLADAGNSTDPIEVMMIEQIALAHFHIGRLHYKACSTAHGPLAVAYADAATRLTAEFRRPALAFEDYRAKQLARTQAETINPANPVEPELEKPQPKPKKKPIAAKVGNNASPEMSQWLKESTAFPTRNGSRLAVSIN